MARVTACRLRFGPGNVTLRQMKPAAEKRSKLNSGTVHSPSQTRTIKTGGHQSAAEEHQVRLDAASEQRPQEERHRLSAVTVRPPAWAAVIVAP